MRRLAFALLAALALTGAGLAVSGIASPSASHKADALPAATTPSAAPAAASGFVAGSCAPACSPTRYVTQTISVPDSSAPPYGKATPATVSRTFAVERPANLASTPAPPLVIAFAGSISGDPQWINASAADGFVLVQILPTHLIAGVDQYAFPTTATRPVVPEQNCGSSGTAACDDIPEVQAVISALECPYTGRGTCEGVNGNELFVEGGSKGGLAAEAVACDTRTSPQIAGMTDVSFSLNSPRTGATSNAGASPPNCPALLGYDPSTCIGDCVSAPLNHNISLQYIWGSADTNFGGPGTTCPSTAGNCLATGYVNHDGIWAFGLTWLATKIFGETDLGCPSTPASTTTSGSANAITTVTYTPCLNASVPSATATQTVEVAGAGHMPDFYNGTSFANGAGLQEAVAAWTFWTTYPSRGHLPASTAPPSITGSAVTGGVLVAAPGSWSFSPIRYAYQWERCNRAGAGCAAIAGATGQRYTVGARDVGSTIRVVAVASNGAGAGAPATSSATAAVKPNAPDTKLVNVLVSSKARSVRFRARATGAASGFQCALVRAPTRRGARAPSPSYHACRSTKTFTGLLAGRYTLYVRAVGPGGVDRTPATFRFTLS